jgi:hypothetical protein
MVDKKDILMPSKQHNKNFLFHGIFTEIIGLAIYLFGPIEFRGFPVSKSTGLIICVFGFVLLSYEFIKRRRK